MPTPDDSSFPWQPPPPPPPDPRGKDRLFLLVLLLLAGLVAFLWFTDPSHRSNGESRDHWPSAETMHP